jgi:O-antigen/teichoic acid export membrane protein
MFKQIKELGSDSVIYGLGSSISQFIGLFLVPFYTKALTPSDYGVLAIVGLFTQFTNPILSLGLDNALFRYFSLSKNIKEEKGYLTTAVLIKSLSASIFIILIYFAYPLLNEFLFKEKLNHSIFLVVLATIFFGSIGSISEVVIRVQRKPKVFVVIQLIVLVIGLTLSIYWVLILKWGVYGALLASMVGFIIRAISLSIYLRKYISYSNYSFVKAKTLLAYALPYVPHKLQGQTMQIFSLFIINQQMGIAIAGVYSVVNKFVKPIWLIVSSVQKAWVPYKFQLHKKTDDNRPVFKSISGNYWFSLVLVWSISSLVFPFIFKIIIDERYHLGFNYFPFLAFIPLVQAFYFTVNTGIELRKSQKILPVATFFGMLTVVSVSLLTVTTIAPYGPIIAQSLSFFVIAMITFKYAREVIKIDYPFLLVFLHLSISIVIIYFNYHFENVILTIISLLLSLILYLWIILKFNNKNLRELATQVKVKFLKRS